MTLTPSRASISLPEPDLGLDAYRDALTSMVTARGFAVPQPSPLAAAALERSLAGASPGAVAQALERDPLLAVVATRIGRSALYRAGAEDAEGVMREAGPRARDILLEAVLERDLFRQPGYTDSMVRVRTHSTAVAHAARAIAIEIGVSVDDAFLLGLFHDAGLAASLRAIAHAPATFGRPNPGRLATLVGETHEELGARLATVWGLPTRLCGLIKLHHDPRVDRRMPPLLLVLLVAEALVDEHGMGVDVVESHACFDRVMPCASEGLRMLGATHAQKKAVGRGVSAALEAVRLSL